MAWNDEKKQEVIDKYSEIMENEYQNDEERAEHTMEVVSQLASDFDETPNGVRMVLSRAGVYYKKQPAKPAASSGKSGGGGGKRVNKAEAQESLRSLIQGIDPELVDEDIITKLTGKAAAYFVGVITTATSE